MANELKKEHIDELLLEDMATTTLLSLDDSVSLILEAIFLTPFIFMKDFDLKNSVYQISI